MVGQTEFPKPVTVSYPSGHVVAFPDIATAQQYASTAWQQIKDMYGSAKQMASDAGSAIAEDIQGMLPKGIPDTNSSGYQAAKARMDAGKSPVPSIMESEREREIAEQEAGYSKPYRLAAHAASVLGTNVEGMEQAAKEGKPGKVLGHAATPLATMAAGETLWRKTFTFRVS